MTMQVSLLIRGDATDAKAALAETSAATAKLGAATKTATTQTAAAGAAMRGAAVDARALATSQRGAGIQTGNLAAQFNDIGVQLAGGQSPLLIALQQGTQISQEFGNAGASGAVRALPSPPQFHTAPGIDRGVTNVRNVGSPHWRRWLGPAHRCLIPLTRFAEPRGGKGAGNAWFELVDGRPAFFAGLWVPGWTSMRKLRDGLTTDDLFAFLTTEPNAEVATVHPKAMPVILTERVEWEVGLSADSVDSQPVQRPLKDGLLCLVPATTG